MLVSGNLKILIVDDSKFTRNMVIRKLPSSMDIEYKQAVDGAEAVELFQEYEPDLVLLDLTMPVMDGYEALNRMRAINPDALIVICTADIQPKAKERVLASGAHAILSKPISSEELEKVMHELFV